MPEDKEIKVNVIPLAFSFKDAQRLIDIKVKMSIVDGAVTSIYNDAGFCQRAFIAMKQAGLKVVCVPRKNIIVQSYEGKTAQEIKDYELAMIKQSGHKGLKIEGMK